MGGFVVVLVFGDLLVGGVMFGALRLVVLERFSLGFTLRVGVGIIYCCCGIVVVGPLLWYLVDRFGWRLGVSG